MKKKREVVKKKKYKCGGSISWDKSQTYGQKLKYLANFCKSFVKN